MIVELLPNAYQTGTTQWDAVTATARVNLGPGETSTLLAVLIPAIGSGTYRFARISATTSELIALCQRALRKVVQSALQRPFQLEVTGQYDCATAGAMPIVSDIVGQTKGSTTLGFRELAYLLGSNEQFQAQLVEVVRGAFEVDGGMVLVPGSFVPAAAPASCPVARSSVRPSSAVSLDPMY